MGHHGDEPFDGERFEDKRKLEAAASRNKLMRDLLDTAGFRGALGDYPEGKLTPADEGAIQFAIGISNGKVVLDFGTSVHWVGLSAQQAADLASLLLKRARECGRANGETIGFTIS
jgi:hypothetical protein